jgi:hypothetical protein
MANICTGTFYSYQSVTTCGTVHSLVCTTSLLVVRVVTVLSELALTSEKKNFGASTLGKRPLSDDGDDSGRCLGRD